MSSRPTLLVANRGEIAVRILRTARTLGVPTIAIYAEDDARALHVRHADQAVALAGRGARAYLDLEQVVNVARANGATLVHPGYGFLSENPDFAAALEQAAIPFVGPSAATLRLFGDKVAARALAEASNVPVIPGTKTNLSVTQAAVFLREHGAIMLKATHGGGGRGMRAIDAADQLSDAFARCQSEARAAFGSESLFAEKLIHNPRHVEVQIVSDGKTHVHLGTRECSLQRRHQKLVEFAPANLPAEVSAQLAEHALALARAADYTGIGTVEFLVAGSDYYFIETNPRIQVEHTVTEMITGVDLVAVQLGIATGRTVDQLGVIGAGQQGAAVQVRVNMEAMLPDGTVQPGGGTLGAFEPPAGPGIRVDTFGYTGYQTSPAYDSLLAKVIAHGRDYPQALSRAYQALTEFRIHGTDTNITFLQNLLTHPDVVAGNATTGTIDAHYKQLLAPREHAERFYADASTSSSTTPAPGASLAGAQIDESDPLAVLAHGKTTELPTDGGPVNVDTPDGHQWLLAPMQGTIVSVEVEPGVQVHEGQALVIMDAMKMEHEVHAPVSGRVHTIAVNERDAVFADHPMILIEQGDVDADGAHTADTVDLDHVRDDLAEVVARHDEGLDANRPDAVARRRKTGHRTARENVAQLVDDGSFVEYGPLVLAAQRRRRSEEELREKTPADGLVAGVGTINGNLFPPDKARAAVMSYDYTVLAGTQGGQNHRKKDRLFEIAEHSRLPVVFFTEGGGGRPGDTDGIGGSGLDCWAFNYFGRLSGLVPLVGITSGRCFAGNAALLGCCDVVIATKGSNIGMGGPAMIEGGGLGVFRPEEVGPMSVQVANGVVDVPVDDYPEAVEVAKKYLSYFQGPIDAWDAADQRQLRFAIPENRLRVYDIRTVIETLADTGSVLELRRNFGVGMLTALARIEGRPLGIIANNPTHLSGAIDSDGADKATRFMQLCDAFDIPLLFLCDTPGIMVGPEIEKKALCATPPGCS